MIRVLLVHNFYGSGAPSGENRVFELERELLMARGHEVETLEFHSDVLREMGNIGNFVGGLFTPWNPISERKIARLITHFQPDVVHAHNTFPFLSPSIFKGSKGVARVATLHNYRIFCAAGVPMRDGSTCLECINKQSIMPAIRHGCYRNSRVATLPLAINVSLHRWRNTWARDVERFIAFTEFQRSLLVKAGLPSEKIDIKPNFFPGFPIVSKYLDRPQSVVFVGRLSSEKGVEDLIDAWLRWDNPPQLRIVGEGPLKNVLEEKARSCPSIVFLGGRESSEAEHEIMNARLLVLPSRCIEGFPMVIREALAFGTPVAVSDIGPLPGLVKNVDGIVFGPADSQDLYFKVRQRWGDEARMKKMSEFAQAEFFHYYTEQKNYDLLMEIYKKAIADRKIG